ncbi:hypothetical protein A0256_00750 [Mucilaginibacter sp. PAMC 26640]|nr:hypothetical protein A0256_00750 [Mucilaginibacter sp. PAMC 26640]
MFFNKFNRRLFTITLNELLHFTMSNSRNKTVDFLRFLGLSLIILAHLSPPAWLFQLRNFDVPLMVLVSGLTYSIYPSIYSYKEYVNKRIKRLVYPAWTFLTIYFTANLLMAHPFDHLTFGKVFHSYTFMAGIGYVWIFRVFLITALCAPFIERFNAIIPSNNHFLIILVSSFFAYEMLFMYNWKGLLGNSVYTYFEAVILFGVFYILVFSLGTRLSSFSRRQISFLLSICVTSVLGFAVYFLININTIPPTQQFKFPPRAYYLSYSLVLCLICYVSSPAVIKFMYKRFWLKNFVVFVSSNTVWIYFYHIIFIKSHITSHFSNLFVSYVFVYAASVMCCFLQLSLVNRVLPKISSNAAQKNIVLMLIG